MKQLKQNGLQWPYKAIIVLVATTAAWITLQSVAPSNFEENRWVAFWPAFEQMVAVLLVGHLLLMAAKKFPVLQWPSMVFAPVPHRSLGVLFSSLLTLYWLIGGWEVVAWDVYLLLHVLLSFLIGSTVAMLLYYAVMKFWVQPQELPYAIDRARVDMFVGTMVASLLLGSTFHVLPLAGTPSEGVIFPLVLGIWNIGITMAAAVFVGHKPKESRWWVSVGAVSVVSMMVLAAELVRNFLPDYWTFNGREYGNSTALLAVELGLFAGWVAGVIIRLYDRIAAWYLNYLLSASGRKVWVNLSIRVFINLILPVLPVLLVSLALLGSYATSGLYGTSLALLGMLSNVGMSIVIEQNQLNTDQMPITAQEKRKIELISPSISGLLGRSLQRVGK